MRRHGLQVRDIPMDKTTKLIIAIKDARRILIEIHGVQAEQRTKLERAIDQLSEALAELGKLTEVSTPWPND